MSGPKIAVYYAWSRPLEMPAHRPLDLMVPPHAVTPGGCSPFDGLLPSRPAVFAGDLRVSDATLRNSTTAGTDGFRRLSANVRRRSGQS